MENINTVLDKLKNEGFVTFYVASISGNDNKENIRYALYNIRKVSEGCYKLHSQNNYSAVEFNDIKQVERYLTNAFDILDNGLIINEEEGFKIIDTKNLEYLLTGNDRDVIYSITTLLALARSKELKVKIKIDVKNKISIKGFKEDMGKLINAGIDFILKTIK